MLYYAFVYPSLMYSIACWGNAAKVFVSPILIKQKRALRIMSVITILNMVTMFLTCQSYFCYQYVMNFTCVCLCIQCITVDEHLISVHFLLNLFTVITLDKLIKIFVYLIAALLHIEILCVLMAYFSEII